MTLEQQDYFLIFELMTKNPNISIKDLRRKLLGPPHKKTVTKAHNVIEQLIELGKRPLTEEKKKQIEESVAGYDGTIKYVNDVYNQLNTWRRKLAVNKLLREEHLQDLINLSKSIRRCIEQPNLDERPDYHPLMSVRGYDWRLDPVMWFYLCTPDLSKTDSWRTEPVLLKSHIENNPVKDSPFWEHLDQLWQKVKSLEHDYDKTAIKLMKEDKEFRKLWKSIQVERMQREKSEGYKPSRTPLSLTLITDIKPYYDQGKVDGVMSRFKVIGHLSSRQFEIEQILGQVYKDLSPNEINDIIISGYCDKCPM